ncbi:hypothetical protein B0T25DRAFT_469841 [Lasiosphaeria hispida]|uniref:HNH nuclease domain-containing protein n=1 Tax=Lasiosphaeria hispida TaxID=260671 RepID=A0AAJ0HVE6_9PEZI|nr:hypothetical protein B0T25DRAFT_469841 [Lasiosphaeria hispida]
MATIAPTLQSRRRPPKPVLELVSRDDICFRHPAYTNHSLFLTLSRVDSAASIPTYGVHHRTALLACQIIAGNAFTNSYLSLDKAGQQQVQVPLDSVLTEDEYYFIVEGFALYPIVPSFQDWEFPHGRIPDWWHSVNASPIVTMDCGITNAGYAVEEAHLVPKEERAWYRENEMERYGVGLPDIDNKANLLPLRKDIHYSFDTRWFVIVPKMVTTDSSLQASPQYVTHIISQSAAELWPTYHTTIVESIHPRSQAYLFARFAWAILFRVKLFVIAGEPRHVIRVARTPAGTKKYKTEHCSGAELENAYGGGGSKAATPLYTRKRRSAQASTATDQDGFSESSGDSDTNMSNMDVRGTAGDWIEWGRNRRQESSDETAPDVVPPQQLSEETAPATKVHLEPALEVELRTVLREVIPQQRETFED